jgi:hypothetical protein
VNGRGRRSWLPARRGPSSTGGPRRARAPPGDEAEGDARTKRSGLADPGESDTPKGDG